MTAGKGERRKRGRGGDKKDAGGCEDVAARSNGEKSVLVYSGSDQGTFERLYSVIETVFPTGSVGTCKTLDDVVERLRRPRLKTDLEIAVLVAANTREVNALIDMGDVFEDVRIILVLPDAERETIAKGHLLRPRFLTYVDADFTDLAAVLAKMLASNDGHYADDRTPILHQRWEQDRGKYFNA